MSIPETLPQMDRRKAIQWMLTATATVAARDSLFAVDSPAAAIQGKGYGRDPSMVTIYKPGDVWPLTLTEPQRRTARALCDVIIPADETSPSASAVGVPDFIDEWISSPYPAQAGDRKVVLEGLKWIDDEASKRFQKSFAELSLDQQIAICDHISNPTKSKPETVFFKRYRDLTAGGYYTTAEGMKAIGYVGNVPSGTFAGPPPEALKHVGLA